jgi:hypothetical protein
MLMQVKFWLHQEHGIDNADHNRILAASPDRRAGPSPAGRPGCF